MNEMTTNSKRLSAAREDPSRGEQAHTETRLMKAVAIDRRRQVRDSLDSAEQSSISWVGRTGSIRPKEQTPPQAEARLKASRTSPLARS
jgi:hypothetical protein